MKMHTTPLSILATAFAVIASSCVLADDTELYLNQVSLPPEQVRPNVVFILDSSGSMGLPVQAYGTTARRETNNYDSSVTYAGSDNIAGGAGDSDYYYLYRKPDTYADQYIYYNKVHKDQMLCDMSTVDDSTPYTTSGDDFIYNDGTSNWGGICDANNSSCGFTPGSSGPDVDCRSQKITITTEPPYYYLTDLYVVSANFHNFLQSYYRYSVLQTVVKDLIDRPFDINMALMKFNGGSGGIVLKEAVDANLSSNQADLKTIVDQIFFDGTTPLTESLWEAARYLRGETPTYGASSVSTAFSGSSYNSPIDYACQKSHIILLTDGNPYSDDGRDSTIQSMTGSNCSHTENANAANESCLDNFAGWLATDSSNTPTLVRDHSNLTGDQEINVHTIGFGLDNPLLTVTAANGNGLSKVASTAAELADAFSTILDQVEFEKDTFVAPAVAVNAYNGLQHRDELYFALFQPNSSPRWAGNIKKYTLDGDIIRDQNGNAAIDPTTGYFYDNSLSIWTNPVDLDNDGSNDFTVDGSDIALGGIATQLSDPDARTIYTYTPTTLPNNVTLTEQLLDSNTAITAAMLGVDGAADPAAERTAVINWARGGVTGSPPPNYFVADFIHNRPSVVTYRTIAPANQGDDPTFDDTIYSASNMGLFYAIDADDGSEVFSFVPKELFRNLTTYYQDVGGFTDKVYGLDAPMTVWRYDEDNDGSVINGNGTVDGNDFVYIYQGMRRGGTGLYALDVTLRGDPKLMWQINGKAYGTSPSGDFRNLAQTWSVPQKGVIKWNCNNGTCTEKRVLFFGGGYDIVHDTATSPTSNDRGNALFMVDAVTGDLLWSAGIGGHHDLQLSNMSNSMVADVTLGDTDSDGYIDILFAVDIQGGLWRIDVADEPANAAGFATGGKIAELGGTGSNFRRFYNAPDVAYFAERGNTPFLTISVASGYRAEPRDTTINDYLYVVFDQNALSAPAGNDYTYAGSNVITTSNLTASGTQYGWSKALTSSGEKGLSRTITFGDQIIMTTYVPNIVASCTGTTGGGRYYLLNALTGASLLKDENDNTIPYQNLIHGGIPPEPAVIYTSEDVCVADCDGATPVLEERTDLIVCVGTECVDDVVDQQLHKTFWREN